MTFLEIVFAVTLLGILAATLLGAANFMLSRQKHEQRTLAAAEIANRLILQFLDDPAGLPSASDPVGYGEDQFRWTKDEYPLTFIQAKEVPISMEGRQPPRFDKLKVVKVRVWLATASGEGPGSPGIPHAEISRMYDSAQIFRNPDTLKHILSSEEGQRRLRESATGVSPSPSPPPRSSPAERPAIPGAGGR